MRYLLFNWDESDIGPTSTWGPSKWFVETDDANCIVRQMTVFENGNALKYDTDHTLDEYGSLGDQKVKADSKVVEITGNDFHMKWDSTEALNS